MNNILQEAHDSLALLYTHSWFIMIIALNSRTDYPYFWKPTSSFLVVAIVSLIIVICTGILYLDKAALAKYVLELLIWEK